MRTSSKLNFPNVPSYLIERSHRADLDVPSKILQGRNQDVPRENQSCCSQDISNDSKCSHRAHLLAYLTSCVDAVGTKEEVLLTTLTDSVKPSNDEYFRRLRPNSSIPSRRWRRNCFR